MGKVKHGMAGTRTYRIWKSMLTRCHNENAKYWKNYGGKGIFVCDEWRKSFQKFLDDMGVCPSGDHTIERVDNLIGYAADNCRWATRAEQNRNTKRNVWIELFGERKVLYDWLRDLSISDRQFYRYKAKLGRDDLALKECLSRLRR